MIPILEELTRRGATFTVAGDKLRVSAPVGTLTPEDRTRLADAKPAIMDELKRVEYAQRFGGRGPSPNEARAIEIAVASEGMCLTYCTALDDLVAFIRTDAERKRVPPGFVAYTIEEVEMLCDMPIKSFRVVHRAKQLGGGSVLSVDPLDSGPRHDR